MRTPCVMAIVGHLVILLAIISAVPGDGHNKDSYRVTGFKKFNIEAQNQSKDYMLVKMKGKDGALGKPGQQGDAGSPGLVGSPGPPGDKGAPGVCSRDQCESAELKVLIKRLEALEKNVNNKTGKGNPLVNCKQAPTPGQKAAGQKGGGTVVIVCVNSVSSNTQAAQAAQTPTSKPVTAQPASSTTAQPVIAAPAPAPAPTPAFAPAPAPASAPAPAPISFTVGSTVHSPVSWETPPIPLQNTSVQTGPLQIDAPAQISNGITNSAPPMPAAYTGQQFYKRHMIPKTQKKRKRIHKHTPRKHKITPKVKTSRRTQ